MLGISERCVGSGPDGVTLEATIVTMHGTTGTRVLRRASSIHAVAHLATLCCGHRELANGADMAPDALPHTQASLPGPPPTFEEPTPMACLKGSACIWP